MSRTLGHPAPVALASLRAGLAGGRRGRRLCAHVARCPRCSRVCTQLDAEVAPSQALVGCVLHLTGDVAPKLVDLAPPVQPQTTHSGI
jgi:hypothetical protein